MEPRTWRSVAASALALTAAGLGWVIARVPLERVGRSIARLASSAAERWRQRPGARSRDLARRARTPLPNLYEVHPEARVATPREIGLRSIDLDEIAGTAVGGPAQRGADFKPLPAFRSQNWQARWQRIRRAVDRLAVLPPIDVVRYPPGGSFWVSDGHNRVAAALEVGQVAIDANVTELVPPGENPSERPGDLAAALTGTRSLRAAGQGGRLQSVSDETAIHRVGAPTNESAAEAPAPVPDPPAGPELPSADR